VLAPFSAIVERIDFLRRISMRRLTSFWMLAARVVGNQGISATLGLVPIER